MCRSGAHLTDRSLDLETGLHVTVFTPREPISNSSPVLVVCLFFSFLAGKPQNKDNPGRDKKEAVKVRIIFILNF